MGDFTTNYLAELTTSLTVQILNGIGRKLRDAIIGTEKEQAIERCLRIGLAALLATPSTSPKDEFDHLATIFRKFFAEPDVGQELGALLRGHPLNREELLYLFEHAGFDAKTLPGVSFDHALTAFEAAFLIAATDEPELQGTMQTNQLLAQTHLQRAMLDEMRALVNFLRQAHASTLQIQHGKITAQPQTGGEKIVYQFSPTLTIGMRGALVKGNMSGGVLATGDLSVGGDVIGRDKKEISVTAEKGATVVIGEAPAPTDWESHYLRTLINQCDPLDLTPIDETHAQAVLTGEANAVSVSEVFTTLYLARLTRAPKQKVEAVIRRADELNVHKKMDRQEKRLPIQAVEAVAAVPRLIILGQPGGGKSTAGIRCC